jgi:glycosyltransferase involved in cell wall biosynthesis
MRIVEIETFGRGGLIHYAYNLSCALAERGHDVTLVTTAAYELEEKMLPHNVRVIRTLARFTSRAQGSLPKPLHSLALKIEALIDAVAVTLLARRLNPDIIHLHCTNPISLVYLTLFRFLRQPVAATAHVVTPHERIGFQDAVYRRIHRLSNLIVAHSDHDRQRLLNEFAVDPDRVAVIPHGEYGFFETGGEVFDRRSARTSLGLGQDDEVVLFFGYIREYKGLDVLFDAWEAVAAARPKARLVVAGDPVNLAPARREELENRAESLGAVHRLEYIPFSDVARYFSAADVLAMPYRHISQSGVLFLSLSLGVPVVASRVGGLPEVLNDGDDVLFVPPDAPPALAEALVRVLGDARLRERLASGGRKVALDHSWPSIAERTESVFAEAIQTALLRDST